MKKKVARLEYKSAKSIIIFDGTKHFLVAFLELMFSFTPITVFEICCRTLMMEILLVIN